ncbi:MAG: VWA domain-containing protein [Acidobacteria bacterium]|nr:VWA domain-containing protein [Acidobacteriota bacterium]
MLDPVLLSSIGDLELVARVTVDGTVSGLHRSPFHGYSAEFSQYRHYRVGDDLKYVDWKLFARTVAVDASGSMAFRGRQGVSKLDYARMLAAALAYLVAGQGDAVGLVIYDEVLRQYVPSRMGQSHLRSVLLALSKMQASGGTAAAAALRRATDLLRRRGLLLVVSDLYDEDARVEAELRRAARIGHEVAVFHVLTRDEIEFPFAGDIEIEDLETGRTVLANAAATGAEYRRQFAEFLERWRSRCAGYGIDYTRVITDMPLDAVLRGYLLRRTGSVGR